MDKTYLATVDLGSNSFRLLIGKVVNNQFHTTFSFKENVQLAYGLDKKGGKNLMRIEEFDSDIYSDFAINSGLD